VTSAAKTIAQMDKALELLANEMSGTDALRCSLAFNVRSGRLEDATGTAVSDAHLAWLAHTSAGFASVPNLPNPASPLWLAYGFEPRNRFDPVADYLESCRDTAPIRPSEALFEFFGAAPTHPKVSARAWDRMCVALVARTFNPPQRFDVFPILNTPREGTGKSTYIQSMMLNRNWVRQDLSLAQSDTHLAQAVEGYAIVESSELAGSGDTLGNSQKSWLSLDSDASNRKYMRFNEIVPRRFVLVGTTNELRCLPFDKGVYENHNTARRFVVIHFPHATPSELHVTSEYVARRRDGMWAWAMAKWEKLRDAAALAGEPMVDLWRPGPKVRRQHNENTHMHLNIGRHVRDTAALEDAPDLMATYRAHKPAKGEY